MTAAASDPSALQEQLERECAAAPAAFERRVLRRALRGYAVLPALAAVLGAFALFLVWRAWQAGNAPSQALLLVFGILNAWKAVEIVRHMERGAGESLGRQLSPEEAPRLFALVEEIRQGLGAPRVDSIHLADDLNASACQRPTAILLGLWRNELVLGLPLLLSLDEAELRSVIAHELAHFGGEHGKTHLRVTRAIVTLLRAERNLEDFDVIGFRPAPWISRSLLPELMAMAAVLARRHEIEADAAEVRMSGPGTPGEALKRMVVADAYADSIWSGFWSSRTAGARTGPFAVLSARLPHATAWEGAQGALEAELARTTDPHDSHPCLRDRLAALGADPAMPAPIRMSGKRLLGLSLEAIVAERDRQWWEQNEAHWLQSTRRRETLAALHEATRAAAT